MGYRPNLIARGLKTKETRQILFYSPELLNLFYMEVYKGMEAKAATAIFAFNDMLAIGAISALPQHGIRVPESISIAGFDNLLEARYVMPPLTTMEVSKYELGQISVRDDT